jgi:hypothetical protein
MNDEFSLEVEPLNAYAEVSNEFGLFDRIGSTVRRGAEGLKVQEAIQRGERDENKLTSLIFYARHPERGGRRLERGEPNFDQLSKEWLDIRDRLVRPIIHSQAQPPASTSSTGKQPLPSTSRCPDSPTSWGREKLPKMRRWLQDKDLRAKKLLDVPVGSTLRAMTPQVFPGVPAEAIAGFCANANVTENTTEGIRAQPFHEMGLFGTEGGPRAGPAPNPDPNAKDNSWGKLANHPLVRQLLGGRSATMEHNRWKTQIPDQVAIGLVNVRRHGENVVRLLDARLRPDVSTSSSPFFVACCFMGWSAGDGTAAKHFNRFADALARVPENQRWGRFLREVAEGVRSNRLNLRGLRKHRSPAYSALRTWQKLAAGQLLAKEVGGTVAWFDFGLGSDESWIADTITCAGAAARRA